MFLYFDLGMVLVTFSVERMCRQMGQVAAIDPGRVREILFSGDLQRDYEAGRISTSDFYEAFCRDSGTRPDASALVAAAAEIFELNVSMLPVVAGLRAAGYRLGILSNTCAAHWEFCLRRYAIVGETFAVYATSYQLGVCKPDAAIFRRAAELAGAAPGEIFFTDDIARHVAGARAAGWDAVQYTSTPELAAELRQRGIRFNY